MNNFFKSILSLVSLAVFYFCWTFPVANTASVNQLQDTPTSTSNALVMQHFLSFLNPVIFIIVLIVIWYENLKNLFAKLAKDKK